MLRAVLRYRIVAAERAALAEPLEVELGYFGEVFQTEEAAEGVSAFMEKRPPR